MMPVRICRDCIHHDGNNHLCLHSKALQLNKVTGEETRLDCYQMRIWPCASDGKFWEPWPDVQKQLDQIDSVVDALVHGVR